MSCLQCAQDRYARALSNYVIAMSEEVVETPYGWSTALCGYRDPVRWLCLHIHNSEDEAQACLAETVARGGGVFFYRPCRIHHAVELSATKSRRDHVTSGSYCWGPKAEVDQT
jgi:hypothetical protein